MKVEEIYEALKRKKVVRKGKVLIKYVTDRDGYKVNFNPKTGQAKEERMSPQEVRRRMIASLRSRSKRKSKAGQSARKRAMSMRKRSWK